MIYIIFLNFYFIYKDKNLRIGRILEILDLVSGFVSYKHCNFGDTNSDKVILVTACADNVKFYKEKISPKDDIVTIIKKRHPNKMNK